MAKILNGIVAFVSYIIFIAISLVSGISFGILGLGISLFVLVGSMYILWKFLRRNLSVEQTKKELWSFSKFWSVIAILLVGLYLLTPLIFYDMLDVWLPFGGCIEENPACAGYEQDVMHQLTELKNISQSFLGVFVMIGILHIVYLLLVRSLGPLLG